jgi:hypothetical protein
VNRVRAEEESQYVCPHCGEEIAVPVDVHAGAEQEYVEDCPICCSPVVLRVFVLEDGTVQIDAREE